MPRTSKGPLPGPVALLVIKLKCQQVPYRVRYALEVIEGAFTLSAASGGCVTSMPSKSFDKGIALLRRFKPETLTALTKWLHSAQAQALLDSDTRAAWLCALQRIEKGVEATRAFRSGPGRPYASKGKASAKADVVRIELERLGKLPEGRAVRKAHEKYVRHQHL